MFGKTVYSRRRITVKSACGRLPGFRKLNEKKNDIIDLIWLLSLKKG